MGVEVIDLSPGDPTAYERMTAAVAHVSGYMGLLVLGPLLVYFWQRDRSRFVAFHAVQAAVLHVLWVVLWLLAVALVAVAGIGLAFFKSTGNDALGCALAIFTGAMWLGMFAALATWSIRGAWRAGHGSAVGVPLAGRIADRVVPKGFVR